MSGRRPFTRLGEADKSTASGSESDPLKAAREYGLDLSLLQANLRRTPAERLRQLDAMLSFVHRVRRV